MSEPFRRIVLLVADGFGVGAMPDAHRYGDAGSNTLGNLAAAVGGIRLPTLEKLGIGHLGHFQGIAREPNPLALVGRMAEKSAGKDTTTGHWELAGLVTRTAFSVFPKGFPEPLLDAFVREAQVPGFLGNRSASGTAIIEELGEEHVRSGSPIVYTSADSVFQIAAHEQAFGLERLYQICEVARKITLPYNIGRVIARPFVGEGKGSFRRTQNRRDYSVAPGRNILDELSKNGVAVCSVGKIEDLFCNRGITRRNHTGNNRDSLEATLDFLKKARGEQAFIFTNLVDTDMLFGHRRDPDGYAKCLSEIDDFLPRLLVELTDRDLLIMTSDHGCDPTFKGTDHTREFVPLLAHGPGVAGAVIGERASFLDVAATILDAYRLSPAGLADLGKSFLCKSKT